MKNLFNKLALFISIAFLLNVTGCSNENPAPQQQPWRKITIRLDGQTIEIYNDKQTSSYSRIYIPSDTTQDFTLTDNQKDSIYNLVYDVIKKPVVPDRLITSELAETASFSIINGEEFARSTSRSVITTIDYQYIKSWRNVSDKTNELYLMLARKVHLLK